MTKSLEKFLVMAMWWTGWRKHLQGWQAAALLLLIAGSAVLLVTPRAVAPQTLPPPGIDPPRRAQIQAHDDRLAGSVATEPLHVDVRHVGSAFRRYNLAVVAGQTQGMAAARGQLSLALLRVAGQPQRLAELERLRAYQMQRFVAAVRAWEASGTAGSELQALGGDFQATVIRNGWQGMPERVLRVFFKQRWNQLTGLERGDLAQRFALQLEEERIRYGFLIAHPFVSDREAEMWAGQALSPRRLWQKQLQMIERLQQRDPQYLADLARGVVFYRVGQFELAADAFRRHLEQHPDGRYTLRARNYLRQARRRM